jgi:hypothetical protein
MSPEPLSIPCPLCPVVMTVPYTLSPGLQKVGGEKRHFVMTFDDTDMREHLATHQPGPDGPGRPVEAAA